MGHRLAFYLFQKHGVVYSMKRNGIRLGLFAKMEKKSGVAQCLFLLPAKMRVSLKETKSGLAVANSSNDIGLGPMSITKLPPASPAFWFISCATR